MMMSRVEIGLDIDITAESIASVQYFPEKHHGWSKVFENQNEFWRNRHKVVKLRARQVKSLKKNSFRNFAYILEEAKSIDDYSPLAYLDRAFDNDLFAIGKSIGKGKVKLPEEITDIYSLGTTTIAIPVSDERRHRLHQDWRKSGFLLKPLIVGFPPIVFERKR